MRSSLRRIVFFCAAFVALAFSVVVLNQTLQLAEFAGRLHPLAGTIVLWSLVVVYIACLAVPLVLYFRLPEALRPPATEDGPDFARHLQRLGKRLAANPLCAGMPFENRQQIEQGTRRLDDRAEELMRSSASRIFLTTAVSQNGSLDAIVVLVAQFKLVWDVAHVYNQRPTLRDMGSLYANVLGTAFIAGQLEDIDISEQIQPILSSVLGSAAGVVPGFQTASTVFVSSVLTGSANAFLTLRVGAIARSYSGALVRQERSGLRRSASASAAAMLGGIVVGGAAKVSTAITRASGRTVRDVAARVGKKVKGAGASLVGQLPFGRSDAGSEKEK